MAEQPAKAVTFVENHDYQFGREFNSHVREWFKPLAYAFILLRDRGYPCVFFADYYGSHEKFEHQGQPSGREYLDLLLKLRKQFALGEERATLRSQCGEVGQNGWRSQCKRCDVNGYQQF
jgi:alpha-amylase